MPSTGTSRMKSEVILYSTVRGKVTSGGKRLTLKSVHVGNRDHETNEVLENDGTYGESMNYP